MRLVQTNNHWSTLINILVQQYFAKLTTTCVLWSPNFDLELETSVGSNTVILQINALKLRDSFDNDIYNYTAREQKDNKNNVYYNELTKKLIAAIEQTHCEGFVAFQDDIPRFAQAFQKASTYSIWRSINLRFLFALSKEQQKQDYFQDLLFKNQANILVVEADHLNSSTFHLKANKFVGSSKHQPEELVHISTFYALNRTFEPLVDLYPSDKLTNLQGREIIVGAFDYRPFVAVDFKRLPQYHDVAADNPSHLVHVDGSEIRICHTFCELYNCSLQFDTSDKGEWGLAFDNYTGYGLIGMIIEGKIHVAMGAMYAVHSDYTAIDMTTYVGRSGVVCLVPTAKPLVSWTLPLRPFKLSLWLAILGVLCLETVALFLARKFEQTMSRKRDTWRSCIEFGYKTTLKLFVNQNSNYLVQSHTVRTLLFACYSIDIILTSVYGGGLSAVLTLPTLGETADSVEKLVRLNLTWTGSSWAWLESINGTHEDKNSLYKHLVDNFIMNSMDDMRSMAKTENMAFILERLMFGHFGGGDFITPEALQRLKLMVDEIYNQFTVAMVSRLWPHLSKFNDLSLQWHASGLDKFWEWQSAAKYLNVNEQNQVEASKHINLDLGPTKLNLQNFAGLMVLWCVGMLLSVVAFGLELMCFKLGQRMKEKKARKSQKLMVPDIAEELVENID